MAGPESVNPPDDPPGPTAHPVGPETNVTWSAGMAGSATTSSLATPAVADSPAAVILRTASTAPGDPGVASTWTWAQAGAARAPIASAAPKATAPNLLSLMVFPFRARQPPALPTTRDGRTARSQSSG